MMNKDNLFTPIDGVIVEIEKTSNKAGLEIPDEASQKNEGTIISGTIGMSDKVRKEFKDVGEGSLYEKGKRIKFTEGFNLKDNLYYVRLDKIIGIY